MMAPPRGSEAGFALLVAIIFMSVMLSFGLALGSLGYKQEVLASGALGSQYAFYVADAALECALQADQQQNLFAYTSNMSAPAPFMSCAGVSAQSAVVTTHTSAKWVLSERLALDGGKHCADVMISKPEPSVGGTTSLASQGYDVSCATVASPLGARFASRGLSAHYGGALPPAIPPPALVNGTCGTANGTAVSSAPTTNLCSTGTASAVSGTGPWNWTCSGSNGGTTASCSAPVQVSCTWGYAMAPGTSYNQLLSSSKLNCFVNGVDLTPNGLSTMTLNQSADTSWIYYNDTVVTSGTASCTVPGLWTDGTVTGQYSAPVPNTYACR